MPVTEIMGFGGVAPRVNASVLPDHMAQTALNCTLWNKDLRSLKELATIVVPHPIGITIKSIYRIGQEVDETQYWMAWGTDVNVVRGMIAGDTSERTYYTGDGVPKVTNLAMATIGGLGYPVLSYVLGIPAPLDAPICAASNADAPVETRAYLYTYVSAFGEEGKPSAPTKVEVSQTGSVTLTGLSPGPTGNYQIVSKRIYRSQSTSSGSAIYEFVAEIAVSAISYVDSVLGTDLGEEITTLDYDMPPATMAGIVAMPNGIMAAFDGYDILFCEPFLPYAWPEKYRLTADYPIVGLGVFGSSLVVLTKGIPYLITGVDPANMSMERIELPQSCVAKRSIVSIEGGVIYASPDGLVYVGAGGSRVLTQDKFTRKEWQALHPWTIEAYWTDGKYVATFTEGGGFILDSIEDAEFTFFDDTATAGYSDPVNDSLYLCVAGEIKKFGAGSDKEYTWKSKKFQYMGRTSPAFGRVDADAYPVTFKLYANGVLKHTQTVADERPFALPSGYRPRELEIELSGTNPIRYVGMADAYGEFKIG